MKVHLCVPHRGGINGATFGWAGITLAPSGLISDYSDVGECCWVDQARAELLECFFKGKADALLYLDADICSPMRGSDLVKRMVDVDLPIVAMPYMKRHSSELCLERKNGEKSFERNGIRALGINSCGLGLTLIHREALATMARRFPELSQKSICGDYRVTNLFLPEIVDGEYYGDDRNFFRRARASGLGIYTLLDIPVTHDGATSCVTG
jgi:hypothetical protein